MKNDCCCDSHTPILSCKDATLGYENTEVIKDLSFELYPGEYLSIIGENGSGKSTLMKAMLGLIKPLSGSITVNCTRG
ncbi:MAG: ATP-binding cassette domain-containing protein, partial [Lachnospiraceae bacterium]|nr:ATP-binding cassette domain-containing protein [Lachnospiraceae bacterium]